MGNLHLTKVAVGCRDLDSLRRRMAARASGGEVRIATRMRPRRSEELVGGCLYWIVAHRLIARQAILRFDDRPDGRIDIVCSSALEPVVPTHRRAHQGWRYLEEEKAGRSEADLSGVAELPPGLFGKLAALALV